VDDSLHATRAAVEEGIVPGGGVALARASLILSKLKADNDDQRFGIDTERSGSKGPLCFFRRATINFSRIIR
jgi:chaperonin GroEL